MRDVAGVHDERGLVWHGIDQINRPLDRPADIGIGVRLEADMRIADLDE